MIMIPSSIWKPSTAQYLPLPHDRGGAEDHAVDDEAAAVGSLPWTSAGDVDSERRRAEWRRDGGGGDRLRPLAGLEWLQVGPGLLVALASRA